MLAEDLPIDAVRRLIRAGAGVDQLEDAIDRLELDPDERAGLWLAAWSNDGRPDPSQPVPGLYLG